MPTVFSHPAVALASLPVLNGIRKKTAIVLTGIGLTILPDLDVLAFKIGIPYHHMLGHRGLSHSLIFSLAMASMSLILFRQTRFLKTCIVWCYLFFCGVSHGILDAMTSGGLGVGFFIPFSSDRFFFDYRPIKVSTLNLQRFFEGSGMPVIQSELSHIWIPALLVFILLSIVGFVPGLLKKKSSQ